MKKHYSSFIGSIILSLFCICATAQNYKILNAKKSFSVIKDALDSFLFVYRFESIETPCVYIDEKNTNFAYSKRHIVNSNYRVVRENNPVATGNVKCMSQYCARYMKLKAEIIDTANLTISGSLQSSYSYPASSIMQFLTFSNKAANKTENLFNKFISSPGTFTLFPENDKYRIRVVLTKEPYNIQDTIYGYVEITQAIFNPKHPQSTSLYFDKMSIQKGDKSNEISLRFSSTSHATEVTYYSMLCYNVLIKKTSPDINEKYNAIYLDNFLKDSSCKLISDRVHLWFAFNTTILPNTDPIPPH